MPSLKDSSTITTTAALLTAGLLWWSLRNNRKSQQQSIPSELRDHPYRKELELAVRLAQQAGDNMKDYCDLVGTDNVTDLQINTKGQPEDFCTAIDLLNEEIITKGIATKYPQHHVIGEESTGTGTIPKLSDDPTWIIDPIDGTTNFASGLSLTCVSIGLCDKGRPVLGVVYAPMLHELYMAVRGAGAYRNGVRLNHPTSCQKKTLADAIVVFEFGYTRSRQGIATMVGALQRVLNHGCRAVRGFGSGVLDLCHVARGSMDVVYAGVAGEGWKPWDYCAGMVVALEAGCCIESLNEKQQEGEEFDIYSKSVICAVNQDLLNKCREVVCEGL